MERGGSCKIQKKKRREGKKKKKKKKKREEPLAGTPPPTTPEITNVKLGVPPTKPSREPSPEQPTVAGKPPKKESAGAVDSRGPSTFRRSSGQHRPSPAKPPPPLYSSHSREENRATNRRRSSGQSPENSPEEAAGKVQNQNLADFKATFRQTGAAADLAAASNRLDSSSETTLGQDPPSMAATVAGKRR